MMVGDQHFDAELRRRRNTVVARDAVVDGDYEARRERLSLLDDFRRQTVAVLEAIRHEEIDVGSHRRKSAHSNRGCGGAVGVVVADDHDFLAAGYRVGETRRCAVDALHRRERRQRRELDVELSRGGDATGSEYARQHRMHAGGGERRCGGRNRTTHDVHQSASFAVSSSAPRS